MTVVRQVIDVVAAKVPCAGFVLKADIRPGVTNALTSKIAKVDELLSRAKV